MNFTEVVRNSRELPVEESVDAVANSLARASILVATDGSETGWQTVVDNSGGIWACFYTDESELLKAVPAGGATVELRFADAFSVIESNSHFAGIFLNSASKEFYPIPQELFARVRVIVDPTGS